MDDTDYTDGHSGPPRAPATALARFEAASAVNKPTPTKLLPRMITLPVFGLSINRRGTTGKSFRRNSGSGMLK